ncbi:MAG: ABC transporter permease [Candidatus Paceibacterota bacterium]|jgi:putative ABC transport system permease protein
MSIINPKIIKLAYIGLKANKTRTALSVLGIVIGVAAVIIIVSVGQGLKALVVNQINSFGSNLISVQVKIPGSDLGNSARSRAEGIVVTTLKGDDAVAMRDRRVFPYIEAVSGYTSSMDVAKYEEKEKKVFILASDSFYPAIDGQMKIDSGRFFTEDENSAVARVIVIGGDVAKKFFGSENAVGRSIKIKQVSFKVVGVLKSRGIMFGINMDEMVVVPLLTGQKMLLGIDYIMEIGIKISDEAFIPQARSEIAKLMRQRHHIADPKNDDFEIVAVSQILDIVNSVTGAISLLLGLLAAISLLVGGVGIMNIMLVIVTERTKEIGLRKALGAKQKDILIQFVLEAILISVLGGVIGIVMGIMVSLAITYAINSFGFAWPYVISVEAILISFFVAAFFGIVFGWYPAKKAAGLNPIEALRFE